MDRSFTSRDFRLIFTILDGPVDMTSILISGLIEFWLNGSLERMLLSITGLMLTIPVRAGCREGWLTWSMSLVLKKYKK